MERENGLKPRFSVIIPTKDRTEQLLTTLGKLTEQLHAHESVEILVINDGGQPLDCPYDEVLVLDQENGGPSAARNKGAALAKGDFLIFLDDDCVPKPGWLTEICREALSDPEAVLAGVVDTPEGCSLYTQVSEHIVTTCQKTFANKGDFGFFLRPCNLCISAALFRKLGGFDEQFIVSEDREFSERCLQAGLVLKQSERARVVHYREFTLKSFWWAHFNYGKGAYHFHRWLLRQDRRRFSFYHLGYYVRVFTTRPDFTPLLLVWQCANLAGFVTAWLQSR
jgi:GT2 family glycosyltransferase